jgi:hypothetical protein
MTEKESKFAGEFEKTGTSKVTDADLKLIEKSNGKISNLLNTPPEHTNKMPMFWCPHTNATAANRCAIYDDVTLQGLDQWLPDDQGHVQGTYYALEAFEPTAEEWGQKVPIIYAPLHAPVGMLKTNTNGALEKASTDKLKARIVGYSTAASIIKKDVGRPLLKVSLGKICDQEVQEQHARARLGISSAFECDQTEDGKYITGNVHPDHILLFPRDALKGSEQRDMTAIVNAMISELEDEDVTTGVQTNKDAEFSGKNRGKIHGMIQDLRAHSGMIDRLCSTMEDMLVVRDPNEQPAASENLEPLLKRAGEGEPAAEENKSDQYPRVPHNPPGYKISEGTWTKPAEQDFERAGHHWDDPAGKTFIQSCFAAVTGETFGDCRLPHHEADGTLNANGVRNALARLSQTQGLGTASDAAKSHLESHLAEFQKDGETKAGEEQHTNNTQKETTMADETKKKVTAEELATRFRKMANEMKEAAEGDEPVSEENLQKYAKQLCEMSGLPLIDDKAKEVPKNNKGKTAAMTDEELGDEAEGKDDTAAEMKEKKAKELLEEADAEEKVAKKANARINALEQKLAKLEAKETATKKGDFANMLKPGYKKDVDTLFPQFTEDPVHFMRCNKGMFQDGSYETALDGIEHVPENHGGRTNQSIAGMSDEAFKKWTEQRAVQLNARISPDGYSSVGTNVRRDPQNPNVFHANMLGTQEGQ